MMLCFFKENLGEMHEKQMKKNSELNSKAMGINFSILFEYFTKFRKEKKNKSGKKNSN